MMVCDKLKERQDLSLAFVQHQAQLESHLKHIVLSKD